MKTEMDLWNTTKISATQEREDRHKDRKIICNTEIWLVTYECGDYSVPFCLYDNKEQAENVCVELNTNENWNNLNEFGRFIVDRSLPMNADINVLYEIEQQNNSCC